MGTGHIKESISSSKISSKMLNIDDWELQLKTGEETDKLRDLQTDGIEIQNMMMLQQMGFDITRTHTGENLR